MRIIALKTLKLYAKKKKEAEQSLFAWHREAGKAKWGNHNDLKQQFSNASVIAISGLYLIFMVTNTGWRLTLNIIYRLFSLYGLALTKSMIILTLKR
jgi:mRNA interferase HigB